MSPDDYRRQYGDGKARKTQAMALTGIGSATFATRAYDAGRRDTPSMAGWITRITHVDNEILTSRNEIVARARDLVRNNPIVAGGVDRRTEAVVGQQLRLRAKPDYEAMGRNFEWADKWARATEAQFRVWGRDSRKLCDAERAQNFGSMMATAYRHWWIDGEALAYIEMRDRGSAYQTCVRLIDPDRLQNPRGTADGAKYKQTDNTVTGGVEVDPDGVVVAYHIRVRHPDKLGSGAPGEEETIRVPREDPDGRPRVIHAFRHNRAEQRRGVSRLVASMRKIKMLDRYDNAELEAALLNAVMAATVKTTVPTGEIAQALAPVANESVEAWSVADQIGYREQNPLYLDGVRVSNLLPNESLEFTTATRPAAHYAEFRAEGLRSIASEFGLSHQKLAQNWDRINYSNARTLLNEEWRGLLDDRWLFTQEMPVPIYGAWLQEAVAIGKVKVPGGPINFFRYRAELTMAEFLGPGRGKIDPKKEAEGSDLDLAAHRTNLDMEAAEEGHDARDILMGAARDKAMREEFGLEPPPPPKKGPGAPATSDSQPADGSQDQ